MVDSTFGYEGPEDSPGLLLWQATTLWQRQIKSELDKHKMTHSQFVVLAVAGWLLEHATEVTQAGIVELSKLEKMTVSKALKELTQHGFVKRREHETDTRAKIVQVTAKGMQKIKKLVPLVESIDEAFFFCLGEQRRHGMMSSFRTLVDHHSQAKL